MRTKFANLMLFSFLFSQISGPDGEVFKAVMNTEPIYLSYIARLSQSKSKTISEVQSRKDLE